ncbi:hypothetical protein [Pararhodospirillum oryzae]|nr:hypothetical protein [Pararhodospirillum oryzae]
MTNSLDSLTRAELKVIEDLFMQEITGKMIEVARRHAQTLAEQGLIEEAVFVTGYQPSGAVTRMGFRLTPIGHFRYCQWCDRALS